TSAACSTRNAAVVSTTTSVCGICGTWLPGTRAGSKAPGRHRRPNRSWLERATDKVFGPDRLAFARLDASNRVCHAFQGRPQRDVQLAAQTNRNRTRLVKAKIAEANGAQQLGERIGGENGHVCQVGV